MLGPAWLTDNSEIADPFGFGDRAVAFMENLTLTEGDFAGRTFHLSRWQARLAKRVYGDVHEDGRRKIRTVGLWAPRGLGKTTFIAGLGLLHLVGPERDAAGQCVVAASDRDQASIAYNAAKRFLETDRTLTRITSVADSVKTLRHPKSASTYRAISHEAYSKHGLNVSFLIGDEIHAWPAMSGRELWRVLTTSMAKRSNPLRWIISTAGKGRLGMAWDTWLYSHKVAAGEIDDPGFLPVIIAAPEDVGKPDDATWKDEELWRAVNPSIDDGYLDIEELRAEARMARHLPSEVETFKQLRLNVWIDGTAGGWLDMGIYDEGGEPIDMVALIGQPCYIGVDLSSTSDLTAVVAVFPTDDGFIVVPKFFVPEDTLRRRQERDNIPYVDWAAEGWVTPTDGAVVDYDVVESHVMELAENHLVLEVPIDRWNATGTMTRLLAVGLPVVQFGQGYASMNAAVQQTERAILARRFRHGGHPVLRWCFKNVVLERDPAGNRKFSKSKASEKIDGAVAAAMAVARAASEETGPSPFEDPDYEIPVVELW